MADLDAGATGTMPSALLPDLIKPVVAHYRAGTARGGGTAYARILPLINYENRQCGLRATKTLMKEGGVIAQRHHASSARGVGSTPANAIARNATDTSGNSAPSARRA